MNNTHQQCRQHKNDSKRRVQKREYARHSRHKATELVIKLKQELEEVSNIKQFLLAHCERLRKANHILLVSNERLREYLQHQSLIQASQTDTIQTKPSVIPLVASYQEDKASLVQDTCDSLKTGYLKDSQVSPRQLDEWTFTPKLLPSSSTMEMPKTNIERLPSIKDIQQVNFNHLDSLYEKRCYS